MVTKLQEYQTFINREWTLWKEDTKTGYKLFYIDEKINLRAIKAEIVIKHPLDVVFKYIDSLENKLVYDKHFESGREERWINDNLVLTYQKYKGKFTFEPRDYYVLLHKKLVSSGLFRMEITLFFSALHSIQND